MTGCAIKCPFGWFRCPAWWPSQAAVAWKSGHIDIAVLILLGFYFLVRSMEFITVRVANLVWLTR